MERPVVQSREAQESEVARLALEDIGPSGDTTASYEGRTIEVFGGVPGEEVLARIVRFRRRRKEVVWGMVAEVLRPSPHRVAPPCPYFGPCSGCQWQHMEYGYQLELKREAVTRALSLFPSLRGLRVSDTVPSPQQFHYRNHARFTVRRSLGALGFVNRITRRFVRVDRCMLMEPWINEALGLLQGRCQETSQLSIRYGTNTRDWLIQPSLRSPDVPLPSGQGHYRERLLDREFRVASPSFFQVNTRQAEQMVGLVRQRLQLAGSELLVDAYAGVGTFAVLLAPFVLRVIAIEESPAAVRDARANAEGIANLEVRQGRTETVLATMEERPHAVILDPPRTGCHPEALQALGQLAPRRVAYVSCDPASLARDLDILARGGFQVEEVQPVDMFPQTHHVECIASLSFKDRQDGLW